MMNQTPNHCTAYFLVPRLRLVFEYYLCLYLENYKSDYRIDLKFGIYIKFWSRKLINTSWVLIYMFVVQNVVFANYFSQYLQQDKSDQEMHLKFGIYVKFRFRQVYVSKFRKI